MAREPEDELHRDRPMYDFGQATANVMLAAADLGIGSGHSAVIDQEQAQRVLGFPDGYFAVYRRRYPAHHPGRREGSSVRWRAPCGTVRMNRLVTTGGNASDLARFA